MLIVMTSFVNVENTKIPITFILILLFYVVNEVIEGVLKKDDVSHVGHLIGAICGCFFGYLYYYYGFTDIFLRF